MHNKANKTHHNMRTPLLLLMLGICFGSCTKNFTSMNTDPTKIASVIPTDYPYMFAYAQMTPTLSPDNFEIGEGAIASIYSQFFSQAAMSFGTDRYVIQPTWLPAVWNPVYVSAAPQLKTIMAGTDSTSAENALARIWWVWMFHRVTDYFGPIPYFQAANGQQDVEYTPQDSIYYDFFKKLDGAVSVLKNHTGEHPFGTYDLVYGAQSDPVSAWIKFANTLRLRLAMRISYVNAALAKTEAEAAVAAGVMTDISGDAYMEHTNKTYNEENGLAVTAGWDDLRMSASMASMLKGYNDPRMSIYWQPAVATGLYSGVRNGLYSSEKQIDSNGRSYNSNLGTAWCTWVGDPVNGNWVTNYSVHQDIMHAAEAWFLRAEGALNGWSMGDNAQHLYETGIRTSMAQWGITDQTVIGNYVISADTPVAPLDGTIHSPRVNNYPIAWSSDPTMQRKQVAQQKWLALFPDGMEGWAEVRRTNLPELYPLVHSDNTDLPVLPVPVFIKRMPFLATEEQTNAAAVTRAVQMLGGPDNAATRLWWDVN